MSLYSPEAFCPQNLGRCGTDEITPFAPLFRFIGGCFVRISQGYPSPGQGRHERRLGVRDAGLLILRACDLLLSDKNGCC
jgi:hypothetical protein